MVSSAIYCCWSFAVAMDKIATIITGHIVIVWYQKGLHCKFSATCGKWFWYSHCATWAPNSQVDLSAHYNCINHSHLTCFDSKQLQAYTAEDPISQLSNPWNHLWLLYEFHSSLCTRIRLFKQKKVSILYRTGCVARRTITVLSTTRSKRLCNRTSNATYGILGVVVNKQGSLKKDE